MLFHPPRVRAATARDERAIRSLAPILDDVDEWLTSVAEEDARIVGVALARPDRTVPAYDCELRVLFVYAPARRRGLGRALLRVTAARLLHAGARAMWCTAARGSAQARFYRNLGFVETATQARLPAGMQSVRFGIDDIVRLFTT